MRREILSWKSFVKFLAVVQRLQPRSAHGADVDLADDASSLQVVKRREEQIIGDHSSAHDCNIETCRLCSHLKTPFLVAPKNHFGRWETILGPETSSVKLVFLGTPGRIPLPTRATSTS